MTVIIIPYTGIYAKTPFYIGVALWQKLFVHVQNACSEDVFKSQLKIHDIYYYIIIITININ